MVSLLDSVRVAFAEYLSAQRDQMRAVSVAYEAGGRERHAGVAAVLVAKAKPAELRAELDRIAGGGS